MLSTMVIGYVVTLSGVSLQNCTAGPFASGNGGGASRQRLLELSHGLGALRHYNDLANHVLSLNQQGAVVTKLLGKFCERRTRTFVSAPRSKRAREEFAKGPSNFRTA